MHSNRQLKYPEKVQQEKRGNSLGLLKLESVKC